MSTFGNKVFGLSDVKVTDISGTVQKDLPVAQQLSVRLRFRSGELSGDDALQAVVSIIEALEWDLNEGGIDLDALGIITGLTPVAAGTTPNQTLTLSLDAGDNMPYFKIYGKSLGDGDDDIHVKIWKAKCTQIEGSFQDNQFFITGCRGMAVTDGSNGLLEIVQNETAAALPTT